MRNSKVYSIIIARYYKGEDSTNWRAEKIIAYDAEQAIRKIKRGLASAEYIESVNLLVEID